MSELSPTHSPLSPPILKSKRGKPVIGPTPALIEAYSATPAQLRAQSVGTQQALRARLAVEELLRRKMEGLSLYQALPQADRFHHSQASERIIIGSNRSGKTQAAAAEVAMAATGNHPWIPYPKGKMRIYCVGFDLDHIKEVMWKKLAREGALKIIPDEFTKQWRCVLPDQPYDAANKEKWRDAAPLLPARFIEDVAWNKKNEDIPEVVWLKNGTVINWYSSKGAPQQGSEIDLAWLDEEIEQERWLPELEARSVTRGGRIFWSCTPEHSTQQLYQMHQRATHPTEQHDIDEFFMSIDDNIYIATHLKKRFYDQLRTDWERRVKYEGKFALSGLVVYPEFGASQVIKPQPIPEDWCRFMVVDPGVQVCAVLFAAVPPNDSEQSEEVHIFDELYIQRCSSRIFGDSVAKRLGDWRHGGYETFIIDRRMGRQTEMGGRTVEQQYSDALAEHGVWSRLTKSGFVAGNPDIKAREEALRSWLEIMPGTNKPTVQIHSTCRSLIWEMEQQYYKKDGSGPVMDKRVDANNHAVTCLEYLADFGPVWTKPKKQQRKSATLRALERIQKRKKQHAGRAVSLGPA